MGIIKIGITDLAELLPIQQGDKQMLGWIIIVSELVVEGEGVCYLYPKN